ncbi:hypothetical protein [Aquimarina sediminis]|uniref:hypothetical protein n=1 Tax=Aquimarina sediminis TaxID=2070536 RepID=UPI000CA019FA|nr:hypothetical protein [Aquimarina sediminis]
MNPLLIAQATKSATSFFSNRKVQIVLLGIVLYFIFRRKIKRLIHNYRQRKFNRNEGRDINQIAQQYRSVANPSGISWMINFDGTRTSQLDALARETKGRLQPIADAYRLKFEESLSDRLRKELSAKDYRTWRDIVE